MLGEESVSFTTVVNASSRDFTILSRVRRIKQTLPAAKYQIISLLVVTIMKFKSVPWMSVFDWDKLVKVASRLRHNVIVHNLASSSQVAESIPPMQSVTDQTEDWNEIPLITTQAPTRKMHEAHALSSSGPIKKFNSSKTQRRHHI